MPSQVGPGLSRAPSVTQSQSTNTNENQSKGASSSHQSDNAAPTSTPLSVVAVPIVPGQPIHILLADYLELGDEEISFSTSPAVGWIFLDSYVPDIYGMVPTDFVGSSVTVTVLFTSPSTGLSYTILFPLDIFNNKVVLNAVFTQLIMIDLVPLLWRSGNAVIGIEENPAVSWLTLNSDSRSISGVAPASGVSNINITVHASTELASRKRAERGLDARATDSEYTVYVFLYITGSSSTSSGDVSSTAFQGQLPSSQGVTQQRTSFGESAASSESPSLSPSDLNTLGPKSDSVFPSPAPTAVPPASGTAEPESSISPRRYQAAPMHPYRRPQ